MNTKEKKVLSIRIPVEVIAMLNKLREQENRSQANMIEELIKRAEKYGSHKPQ